MRVDVCQRSSILSMNLSFFSLLDETRTMLIIQKKKKETSITNYKNIGVKNADTEIVSFPIVIREKKLNDGKQVSDHFISVHVKLKIRGAKPRKLNGNKVLFFSNMKLKTKETIMNRENKKIVGKIN